MTAPRLITPTGKTVELAPETYRQIQRLLRAKQRKTTRARRIGHIDATYGKYAGKTSLVQSLLKERKADLAREEAKIRRRHG